MYSVASSFFPPVQEIWALSKGIVVLLKMFIVTSVYFKFGAGCVVKAGQTSESTMFYLPRG